MPIHIERSITSRFTLISLCASAALLAGCLSAPQEQTLRSAEGGDRIGSTPSVVIHTAGNATLNVFSTTDNHSAPATQPATSHTTITQTVSGSSTAHSAPSTSGDKTNSGSLSGGGQTSAPTNNVQPSTSIPINVTPGSGGLSLPKP